MTASRTKELYRDPRIQRGLQRIAAKGKNYQGLVRSFLTEEAGLQMDRNLKLAKLGFEKERGESDLAFREKRLGVETDIKKADIASREKTSLLSDATRKATSLANIESREKIQGGILGLKEQAFEDEKSQMPWEIGIAAAGVPLEYALGRREEKHRKDLLNLRRRDLPAGTQVRGRIK